MDECESIKTKIQSNMFRYLGVLLEGRERFEDECLTSLRESSGEGMKQLTFVVVCVCLPIFLLS